MRIFGRRQFLAGSIAAMLALRSRAAWSAGDAATELVVRILAARAGYVAIGDRDRARFAADYLAQQRWMVADVLRSTSFLRFYGSGLFPLLTIASDIAKLRALERDLVTAFLLGTGFFERPDARSLTYDGPRVGACANPFARFD
jgi:hypothetical protein